MFFFNQDLSTKVLLIYTYALLIYTYVHIYRVFHYFWKKIIGHKSRATNYWVIKIVLKSKGITVNQLFSLKHEPKPLRGAWEYRLQMATVQLRALWIAVCKFVEKACTFLLGDRLKLLTGGCLHKCHKLEKFQPTWKFDACLKMSWNWTSFCILLEQFWKI